MSSEKLINLVLFLLLAVGAGGFFTYVHSEANASAEAVVSKADLLEQLQEDFAATQSQAAEDLGAKELEVRSLQEELRLAGNEAQENQTALQKISSETETLKADLEKNTLRITEQEQVISDLQSQLDEKDGLLTTNTESLEQAKAKMAKAILLVRKQNSMIKKQQKVIDELKKPPAPPPPESMPPSFE